MQNQPMPPRGRSRLLFLVIVGVVLIAVTVVLLRPDGAAEPVEIPETIEAIIHERCVPCHSADPAWPDFSSPPAGLSFEDPATVAAWRIRMGRTVAINYMPLGNVTEMTDEERSLVVEWAEG